MLEKKIGDRVNKGDILAYLHTNQEDKINKAVSDLKSAYKIKEKVLEEYKHILDVI